MEAKGEKVSMKLQILKMNGRKNETIIYSEIIIC